MAPLKTRILPLFFIGLFSVLLSSCQGEEQQLRKWKIVLKDFVKEVSGTAGASWNNQGTEEIAFEKVLLPNTLERHSSLTMGPDGKLYASTVDGKIKRFAVRADGTLEDPEVIYALQDAFGERTPRLAVGLCFDPASTATNLILWTTHSTFTFSGGPDWDGKLSRLSGPNLENVQDVLIHLPRSAKDHLTNSIAFGPDGALYFTQGSNSAMGSPDSAWQNRKEHLLSGAVLRLDLEKLRQTTLPLDVKTEEGGTYNPYAPGAPLTIYATGIRNAYDLLWHSNGNLYVPTNGSDVGGNVPAAEPGAVVANGKVYAGPRVEAITNLRQVQQDFLFSVKPGGYYGHPNPGRGEFVMNGGNPTPGKDSAQVDAYPVGTLPDANWRGYAFAFPVHSSPNGIIEYKGKAFGGALQGKILVVRFVNDRDIVVLEPAANPDKIGKATKGIAIPGFWGFLLPIDLAQDEKTGNLYVSEFGAEGQIILLRPRPKRDAVVALHASE